MLGKLYFKIRVRTMTKNTYFCVLNELKKFKNSEIETEWNWNTPCTQQSKSTQKCIQIIVQEVYSLQCIFDFEHAKSVACMDLFMVSCIWTYAI